MNVNFQYSKTLAGEGAILLLLGLIPTVGWVLGIVGIVLLLKAAKELSYYYQDDSIYQNTLTGLKYYVVGLIAIAVAVSVGLIGFVTAGLFIGTAPSFTLGFVGGIIAILAGLVVAFIFYVLAASHLRRTFNTLAQKTGETSFNTAGTLLWLGSLLTIACGIGLILILVSWIFATVGFFSMKPKDYQPYTAPANGYGYPPPPPIQPQDNTAAV
jgi:uncharacterized membrane protein